MGMLLALAIIVGVAAAVMMFVHALRAEPSERSHGWLVAVPLLIVVLWVLGTLIMG